MNKITRNKFFKSFIYNKDILNKEGSLPNIANEDVIEFKVGNKYFYKLIPTSNIRSVQELLCDGFLNNVPLNNSAVAYRLGISYLNLFEPHRNGYYFLRIDISSFFHSIQEKIIRECFSSYFSDDYIDDDEKQTLLDGFVALTTYEIPGISPNERFRNKVVLPIGFQTSPVISNIIFRKLDILIQKYCVSKNIMYTRYADDMLFSAKKITKYLHSESFINEIKYLLSIDGFKINKRKTVRSEHTISLNGYILNSDGTTDHVANVRISNKKTKLIEKLLYMHGKGEDSVTIMSKLFGLRMTPKYFMYRPPKRDYLEKYCKDQLFNKITGYRSYLISVIRFNDKYQCVDEKALSKYKRLIESLNNYILKSS